MDETYGVAILGQILNANHFLKRPFHASLTAERSAVCAFCFCENSSSARCCQFLEKRENSHREESVLCNRHINIEISGTYSSQPFSSVGKRLCVVVDRRSFKPIAYCVRKQRVSAGEIAFPCITACKHPLLSHSEEGPHSLALLSFRGKGNEDFRVEI
jgi:hypothetical protein